MKLFLAYANANGNTDGVTHEQLIRHLPLTTNLAEADAIVLLAVTHDNFRFNHDLNKLVGKKPMVVIDYIEYGWEFPHDVDNVLGHGYGAILGNQEWCTLDLFLRENKPLLQFKRELRKEDSGPSVIPIDFLAHLPKQPLSTRKQFDSRPFEVFNSWGYSHPNRARVHGDIFHAMGNANVNVIDGYDKLGGNSLPYAAKTWLSVFTPHWVRKPMSEVLGYQSQSKISLSLYGAGWKCFRHAEAAENSVMAIQRNNLAWSYPWDESNSIQLNKPHEVRDLLAATARHTLFDVYLAAQENQDRYRRENYVPNYVLANIRHRL